MTNAVVIIGGGFAGVTLARKLERSLPDNVPIYLLSEENFLLYSPLLAEVVSATILPAHCVAPIRQLINRTQFLRARVTGIDLQRKEVFFRNGVEDRVQYGQLVFACGVRANMSMIPGMDQYAFPLKTLGDALELRNRVLLQLERAEAEEDEQRLRLLVSFTVVGGGSSGVEVAGALHDFLSTACRLYHRVCLEDCQVTVIETGNRLVSEFPEKLAESARYQMQRRGIDIRLETPVAQVESEAVVMGDGERLATGTTVCTIELVPQALMEGLSLPKEKGFLRVEPDLRVVGEEHVWALGDCARIPNAYDNRAAPPTAQFAVREAAHLARNLSHRLHNKATQPFSYRPRANLATIGHRRAVVDLFGVQLHGFLAWLLWRAVYLAKLPTLLRRFQVFFEWTWQGLFPADVSQFHYQPYRLADGTRFTQRVARQDLHADRSEPAHARSAGHRGA